MQSAGDHVTDKTPVEYQLQTYSGEVFYTTAVKV